MRGWLRIGVSAMSPGRPRASSRPPASRCLLKERAKARSGRPVLVFWICVLFLGFGLFARFNTTVTVALLVGALSVAGAIFLIFE